MRRVHMEAGRLIVSRPGFEALPTMPEAGKALDSDWSFTGTLIASGYYVDPSPTYNGDPYRTLASGRHVIVLPRFFTVREIMSVQTFDPFEGVAVEVFENGSWQSRTQAGVFGTEGTVFAHGDGMLWRARRQVASNPAVYERLNAGAHYQVYAV